MLVYNYFGHGLVKTHNINDGGEPKLIYHLHSQGYTTKLSLGGEHND